MSRSHCSAFTDFVADLVEGVLHEVDDCRERMALLHLLIQIVVGKGHEAKPTLSTSFLYNRHRHDTPQTRQPSTTNSVYMAFTYTLPMMRLDAQRRQQPEGWR
jgi:hypothetical protein